MLPTFVIGLREGLELEDAGENRVVGKMTREKLFLASDSIPRGNRRPALKRVDRIDETERGAVWEKCNECVGLGCHAS